MSYHKPDQDSEQCGVADQKITGAQIYLSGSQAPNPTLHCFHLRALSSMVVQQRCQFRRTLMNY
jgi:hypothetical protein